MIAVTVTKMGGQKLHYFGFRGEKTVLQTDNLLKRLKWNIQMVEHSKFQNVLSYRAGAGHFNKANLKIKSKQDH